MRTIKFRGKSVLSAEWVYGGITAMKDGWCSAITTLTEDEFDSQELVYPDTIGQYTGLLDKNGKEIYEGDIITCINKSDSVYEIGRQMIGFVAYEENGCYWFCKNNFQHYDDWAFADDIEVIGNIYDNEELLKEK